MLPCLRPIPRNIAAATARASVIHGAYPARCAQATFTVFPRRRQSTRIDTVTAEKMRAQETITQLLSHIDSRKQVDHYLQHYAPGASFPGSRQVQPPPSQLAVIKVCEAVVADELEVLVSGLAFLYRVGLFPVVVHGGGGVAGPEQHISSQRRQRRQAGEANGARASMLAMAPRRVLLGENLKLVDSLERQGVPARPISTGVFVADALDRDEGRAMIGIDREPLTCAIHAGCLPVLAPLAQTRDGQILHVDADTAALELAKALEPFRMVFVNKDGGLLDSATGQKLHAIHLDEADRDLVQHPWLVTHDAGRHIDGCKSLLKSLPAMDSISFVSASRLPAELLPLSSSLSGTRVYRGRKILKYDSTTVESIDWTRLGGLIEQQGSCPTPLHAVLRKNSVSVYTEELGHALAIVSTTRSSCSHERISVLEKWLISSHGDASQDHTLDRIWHAVRNDHPSLVWRYNHTTTTANTNRDWHFERADGFLRNPQDGSTTFFYGIKDHELAMQAWNSTLAADTQSPSMYAESHQQQISV